MLKTSTCFQPVQAWELSAKTQISAAAKQTFRAEKKTFESLESERFIMSVARVVNRCEKFDDCGCANKWEWISVNDSRIGLVGRRREKPVGHLTLRLFVPAVKMLCNPKQYDEGHFTKEDQLSWK